MAILNFGSLNIDMTYAVDEIAKPGQTIPSKSLKITCGGKGFNQSIALAKAGASVCHAGKAGSDGTILIDKLKENNVNIEGITISDCLNGHAVIQVDKNGENCIILHGGSNQTITEEEIDKVLARFTKGDMLVLQNEINNIPYIIKKAKNICMKVAINLAPVTKESLSYPLSQIDYLIVNETEGEGLTGLKDYSEILTELADRYPVCVIVLTLGADGLMLSHDGKNYIQPAYDVKAVDTTSAGDTFIGYFIDAVQSGKTPEEAADWASRASALCVAAAGSSDSIPSRADVLKANLSLQRTVRG